MFETSIYLTAFFVGLLGGAHCLSMCGAVVGTLSFSVKPTVQQNAFLMLLYQLSYNFGRLSSYSLIGGVFGFLGAQVIELGDLLPFQQILKVFSGLFMIALGLYLANWWLGVVWIEQWGQKIWQHLKPFMGRVLPVTSLPKGFIYGFFWGWLPCGLVYSMLIMALSSGSALSGGLVMLMFGLGTLPNLLLMGSFAFFFTRLSKKTWVKQWAGGLVILMGIGQVLDAMI